MYNNINCILCNSDETTKLSLEHYTFQLIVGMIFLLFALFGGFTYYFLMKNEISITEQFISNASTKELYDSKKEKSQCKIDEIRERVTFIPDTFEQTPKEGFDNCVYDIEKSKR